MASGEAAVLPKPIFVSSLRLIAVDPKFPEKIGLAVSVATFDVAVSASVFAVSALEAANA